MPCPLADDCCGRCVAFSVYWELRAAWAVKIGHHSGARRIYAVDLAAARDLAPRCIGGDLGVPGEAVNVYRVEALP